MNGRTIVLRGIPADMPESGRDNLLRCYYNYGAVVRWIGKSECILAFPTEKNMTASLASATRGSLYSMMKISEIPDNSSYFKVAAEMQAELKPEHDARVANRMIGAALGIRVPPKSAPQAAPADKPKPVVDSWDD